MQGKNARLLSNILPGNSTLTEKKVMDDHLRTLHGGVGSIMTEVRQKY